MRDETEAELRAHAELRGEELGLAIEVDPHLIDAIASRRRQTVAARFIVGAAGHLRTGLRSLRKDFTYTATVLATLGLSMGAAIAVFAVVNSVLLAPLAYEDPDRLHIVWALQTQSGMNGSPSLPDFRDWSEGTSNLASLAFMRGHAVTHQSDDGNQRIIVAAVTPQFPTTLRARAALGSLAGFSDPGEPTVVLNHSTWMNRFGADPDIIGESIILDGTSHTVVAVLERGASYPLWAEGWVQLTDAMIVGIGLNQRDYRLDNRVLARLTDGATVEQLDEALASVVASAAETYPQSNADWGATSTPLRDTVLGESNDSIGFLMTGVLVMVLIAGLNVAMLSLARGLVRNREMAVRRALGASRFTLVGQVMVESVVVSLTAGALGATIAHAALAWFANTGMPGLPRADEVSMSPEAVGFAVVLSLVVSLLFGAAPALRAGESNLTDALRGTRAQTGGTRGRSTLVVLQVGLAVALVSAAGTLMVSLHNLRVVDPGFEADQLYSLRVEVPAQLRTDPEGRLALYRRLAETTRSAPEVQEATVVSHAPLSGTSVVTSVQVAGIEEVSATLRVVESDYFAFMGIPLTGRTIENEGQIVVNEAFANTFLNGNALGRSITAFRQASSDHAPLSGTSVVTSVQVAGIEEVSATLRVVESDYFAFMGIPLTGRTIENEGQIVVNEAFANTFLNGNALGRSITAFRQASSDPNYGTAIVGEIVGIAGNTLRAVRADPGEPIVYVHQTAQPWTSGYLMVRGQAAAESVVRAIRQSVAAVAPAIPRRDIHTVRQLAAFGFQHDRFTATLASALAISAGLLATSGLMGLLMYQIQGTAQGDRSTPDSRSEAIYHPWPGVFINNQAACWRVRGRHRGGLRSQQAH